MRNTTKFISDWKLIIGIQFILTVFIAYLVKKINVLPFRYYILFATGLAFLLLVPSLLSIPSKASKKRLSIRCVLGKVLSIIISVSLVLGSVFMHYTTGFLKRITTTEEIITYSILVLDESDYHTLSDLNEKKIGLNPNMDSSIFSKINDAIKEEITYKKKKYYNTEDLSDSIFDQSVEAILINRAYYDIFEEYHNGFEDDTRVVWNFNISTEQEELVDNTEFDITKNSFTVCISGVDSRGSVKATSRSDVNMLVTVNPETHQFS